MLRNNGECAQPCIITTTACFLPKLATYSGPNERLTERQQCGLTANLGWLNVRKTFRDFAGKQSDRQEIFQQKLLTRVTRLSIKTYNFHWLPIESRIKFKIACITYKTVCSLYGSACLYLHSVLKWYAPSRRLRSSDCSLLAVPRVRTCFGSRSFAVAAPTPAWNYLPLHIRNSSSISSFRRQLKTFLYKLAFDPF